MDSKIIEKEKEGDATNISLLKIVNEHNEAYVIKCKEAWQQKDMRLSYPEGAPVIHFILNLHILSFFHSVEDSIGQYRP